MKCKSCWMAAVLLTGGMVWVSPGVAASEPAPANANQSNSWWDWHWPWPWAERVFGLNFGDVRYGNGTNRVVGSDRLAHQPRQVPGVRSIELQGPINVVIKQGQNEKVTLHTDDNIAPLIETKVSDGVLHIGVQPGASFRTKHPVGVTVELVQLDALRVLGSGDVTCAQLDTALLQITAQGSGDVRIDDLRAAALAVLVQGSGDVHLSGSVPKQGYVIEGSGDVDADELAGRELAVRVAGSGDARVWATDKLAVEIAGSGDVCHRGNPALTKSVHGSGDVRPCH